MSENVPKLRFPGFEDEWKISKFKKVVKASQGLQIPISRRFSEFNIDRENYITIPFIEGKKVEYIENPNSSVICKEEDLLVVRTGSGVGRIITGVKGAFHNNFFKLNNIIDLNSLFLFNYLNKPYTKFLMRTYAGTSAIPDLNHSDFYSIDFNYPLIKEQNKIASFLTSVNSKINLLSHKIDLMKQYKKGIMQKIFSQNIRFKDDYGNNYPEWEEKTIYNCLKESRVKGDTGDIARKITVKLWNKGVYEKEEINQGSSNTQYYKRSKGQFIYSKLDFLNCAFGILPDSLDGFQSTIDLPCFDFKEGVNKYYFLMRVSRKNFYKKYGDQANGSRKAKRINPDVFYSMPISLPSYEEQNKIASFLSSIDSKISQIDKELMYIQKFKKGLLQEMFI